jgi:hypothetical protein
MWELREWQARCPSPHIGSDVIGEVLVRYKLDIFRRLPDGQLLWVKAVEGLEEAKSQLGRLVQINPGDYLIYDTRLGCTVQRTDVSVS